MGLFNSLSNFFSKSRKLSEAAVKAVNILKSVVESPVMDVVSFIIPGNNDDKIILALRHYLPKIALDLNLVHSALSTENPEVILDALSMYLQLKSKDERGPIYEKLAALIYRDMKDKSITVEDARALTQYVYNELKRHKS